MDRQEARRLFLQWLMSERICTLKEAEAFYCQLFKLETPQTEGIEGSISGEVFKHSLEFESFMDFCGTSLSMFGLKLARQTIVTDSGKEEYVAVCNSKSDRIAQVATNLTSIEIKHFKTILKALSESDELELPLHTIANLLSMPRSQTSTFLSSLVNGEWMNESLETGKFSLGPRSILELGGILKEENDSGNSFFTCSLCSSLLAKGHVCKCLDQGCAKSFHLFCLQAYQSTINKSECPGCHAPLLLDQLNRHVDSDTEMIE